MAQDVNIDVSKAIDTITREFADLKGPRGTSMSKINTGIARAMNRTIASAKTQASKEIRSQYKVKQKDLSKHILVQKSRANNLVAKINVSARPIPMVAFSPRQTKKGVTINITGQRKLIKGAFIATMKSGHKGVFNRGGYSGTSFNYRTHRVKPSSQNDTPIGERYTSSPFGMITNAAVAKAVATRIETDFPNRLVHELKFLRSRG